MLHELNNGLFIALHDYCNIAKIVPALCAALFKSCFIILDHVSYLMQMPVYECAESAGNIQGIGFWLTLPFIYSQIKVFHIF